MANKIRFDPFRDLQTLHSAMDQLFDMNYPLTRSGLSRNWAFPMDVIEDESSYLIRASIPGIDPNELDVIIDNNVLTIKGEVRGEKEFEDSRYHVRERMVGEFTRSVSIPTAIDDKAVEASYEAGVLTLRLPKSEAARPKRIEVNSGKKVVVDGNSK
jgi:HSP20 family protein